MRVREKRRLIREKIKRRENEASDEEKRKCAFIEDAIKIYVKDLN